MDQINVRCEQATENYHPTRLFLSALESVLAFSVHCFCFMAQNFTVVIRSHCSLQPCSNISNAPNSKANKLSNLLWDTLEHLVDISLRSVFKDGHCISTSSHLSRNEAKIYCRYALLGWWHDLEPVSVCSISHPLTRGWRGLWLLLQPPTKGRTRCFGFTLGSPHLVYLYIVYGWDQMKRGCVTLEVWKFFQVWNFYFLTLILSGLTGTPAWIHYTLISKANFTKLKLCVTLVLVEHWITP